MSRCARYNTLAMPTRSTLRQQTTQAPVDGLRHCLKELKLDVKGGNKNVPSVAQIEDMLEGVDHKQLMEALTIGYNQLGTVLHTLCATGRANVLRAIVDKINPDDRFGVFRLPDDCSRTLLHEAAANQHPDVIKLVLESLKSQEEKLLLLKLEDTGRYTALDCTVHHDIVDKDVATAILQNLSTGECKTLIEISPTFERSLAGDDSVADSNDGPIVQQSLKHQLSPKWEEFNKATKDLDKFKSKVVVEEKIQGQVTALQKELENVMSKMDAQSKELEKVKGQVKELEPLKKEVSAQSKAMERVKVQAASQNKAMEQMKEKFAAQTKELERIKVQVKELEPMKKKVCGQSNALGQLKGKFAKQNTAMEKVTRQVKELGQKKEQIPTKPQRSAPHQTKEQLMARTKELDKVKKEMRELKQWSIEQMKEQRVEFEQLMKNQRAETETNKEQLNEHCDVIKVLKQGSSNLKFCKGQQRSGAGDNSCRLECTADERSRSFSNSTDSSD